MRGVELEGRGTGGPFAAPVLSRDPTREEERALQIDSKSTRERQNKADSVRTA